MKSKAAKNRKKNRRKKKHASTKADEIARDIREQATLDSLDPLKNTSNENLFVFDSALPHGRNKMIKNKTTFADRTLTSKRLGIVLPKHTGKTFQEKRKLNEAELNVIEGKVKRMKRSNEETEEETKGENEGDMEVDNKESVVIEQKSKKIKVNGEVTKTTSVQVYDLWGGKTEPAQNPKESFIQEILHPKQREFVYRPLESKLAAVPAPSNVESYRPVPELHEATINENKKISNKLNKKAMTGLALQKKLLKNKQFFPRVDIPKDGDPEEEEEEEGEPIRAIPKRHKTKKEKNAKRLKNLKRDVEEREAETKRQQREIYRIPEIVAGIEEEERARDERKVLKLAKVGKRFDAPLSADGKKVKQPALVPLASGTDGRLRTLNGIVNPLKERLLSMQNRGLVPVRKANKNMPKAIYKLVEPQHVRESVREDEEKYLRPILESMQKEKKNKK